MALGRARAIGAFAPVAVAVLLVAMAVHGQADQRRLERARQDIEEHHYQQAQEGLEALVRVARDETLQEALYLLAGLQRDGDDARELYRRSIDVDPSSEQAQLCQLELAKMEYALGNYDRSWHLLSESNSCAVSDEACLFEGLSAMQMGDFREARGPLGRVRRGKQHTWAYLSLAEAAAGMGRRDEACERYRSLAGTMISPTAVYRWGECLEDEGDRSAALDEFQSIVENFPGTPEAVLAAEKLQRMRNPEPQKPVAVEPPPAEEQPPLERGFTIQFGSFQDRANAIKLASKIKRVFPGVRIDSELVRYREYHRVRYGYYRTREEAQAEGERISREMNEDFAVMSIP